MDDSLPSRPEQRHLPMPGEIVLMDLPFGDCRFTVVAPGFQERPLTVTLRNGAELKIETVLEVASMGEVVAVKARKRWWCWLFSGIRMP